MLIHKMSIPFRPVKNWKYRIVFASDFHFGAVNCDENLMSNFVDKYASPTGDGRSADGIPTSIFLLGDEIDAINVQDKRFDLRMLHPRYHSSSDFLTDMVNDFINIMRPLKGQIAGSVKSNHLSHLAKTTNVDLMDVVRRELNIKNLGYSSYIPIQWNYYGRKDGGSSTTVLWLSHGAAETHSSPSRVANLIDMGTSYVDADIIVMGHTHDLSVDNNRVVEKLGKGYLKTYTKIQHLIRSGNFLLPRWYDNTGWAPFTETMGTSSIKPPGWATVEISFPIGSSNKQPIIQCFAYRFETEAGEKGTRSILDKGIYL